MTVQLDVPQGRLLAVHEGEPITDRPNRELRLLYAHELLTVSWFRYGPGERGADPHVHRHHADAFYVLAGEIAITLGAEATRVTAGPGTLVLIPAGVIHSFDNDGSAEARFLNAHAPDGGFAHYLRAREDCDQHDPPGDGGHPSSDAVIRRFGEGESISVGSSKALFKAEVGDGDGTFSLTETTLEPGFPGPVPHRHERMVDSFYVLEGMLTLRLGDKEVETTAGSFAAVPPGTVHTFSNRSDETVRMLNLMAPGGLEQYLKEVAAAMKPDEPPDPAVMARIASRYDFHPA